MPEQQQQQQEGPIAGVSPADYYGDGDGDGGDSAGAGIWAMWGGWLAGSQDQNQDLGEGQAYPPPTHEEESQGFPAAEQGGDSPAEGVFASQQVVYVPYYVPVPAKGEEGHHQHPAGTGHHHENAEGTAGEEGEEEDEEPVADEGDAEEEEEQRFRRRRLSLSRRGKSRAAKESSHDDDKEDKVEKEEGDHHRTKSEVADAVREAVDVALSGYGDLDSEAKSDSEGDSEEGDDHDGAEEEGGDEKHHHGSEEEETEEGHHDGSEEEKEEKEHHHGAEEGSEECEEEPDRCVDSEESEEEEMSPERHLAEASSALEEARAELHAAEAHVHKKVEKERTAVEILSESLHSTSKARRKLEGDVSSVEVSLDVDDMNEATKEGENEEEKEEESGGESEEHHEGGEGAEEGEEEEDEEVRHPSVEAQELREREEQAHRLGQELHKLGKERVKLHHAATNYTEAHECRLEAVHAVRAATHKVHERLVTYARIRLEVIETELEGAEHTLVRAQEALTDARSSAREAAATRHSAQEALRKADDEYELARSRAENGGGGGSLHEMHRALEAAEKNVENAVSREDGENKRSEAAAKAVVLALDQREHLHKECADLETQLRKAQKVLDGEDEEAPSDSEGEEGTNPTDEIFPEPISEEIVEAISDDAQKTAEHAVTVLRHLHKIAQRVLEEIQGQQDAIEEHHHGESEDYITHAVNSVTGGDRDSLTHAADGSHVKRAGEDPRVLEAAESATRAVHKEMEEWAGGNDGDEKKEGEDEEEEETTEGEGDEENGEEETEEEGEGDEEETEEEGEGAPSFRENGFALRRTPSRQGTLSAEEDLTDYESLARAAGVSLSHWPNDPGMVFLETGRHSRRRSQRRQSRGKLGPVSYPEEGDPDAELNGNNDDGAANADQASNGQEQTEQSQTEQSQTEQTQTEQSQAESKSGGQWATMSNEERQEKWDRLHRNEDNPFDWVRHALDLYYDVRPASKRPSTPQEQAEQAAADPFQTSSFPQSKCGERLHAAVSTQDQARRAWEEVRASGGQGEEAARRTKLEAESLVAAIRAHCNAVGPGSPENAVAPEAPESPNGRTFELTFSLPQGEHHARCDCQQRENQMKKKCGCGGGDGGDEGNNAIQASLKIHGLPQVDPRDMTEGGGNGGMFGGDVSSGGAQTLSPQARAAFQHIAGAVSQAAIMLDPSLYPRTDGEEGGSEGEGGEEKGDSSSAREHGELTKGGKALLYHAGAHQIRIQLPEGANVTPESFLELATAQARSKETGSAARKSSKQNPVQITTDDGRGGHHTIEISLLPASDAHAAHGQGGHSGGHGLQQLEDVAIPAQLSEDGTHLLYQVGHHVFKIQLPPGWEHDVKHSIAHGEGEGDANESTHTFHLQFHQGEKAEPPKQEHRRLIRPRMIPNHEEAQYYYPHDEGHVTAPPAQVYHEETIDWSHMHKPQMVESLHQNEEQDDGEGEGEEASAFVELASRSSRHARRQAHRRGLSRSVTPLGNVPASQHAIERWVAETSRRALKANSVSEHRDFLRNHLWREEGHNLPSPSTPVPPAGSLYHETAALLELWDAREARRRRLVGDRYFPKH